MFFFFFYCIYIYIAGIKWDNQIIATICVNRITNKVKFAYYIFDYYSLIYNIININFFSVSFFLLLFFKDCIVYFCQVIQNRHFLLFIKKNCKLKQKQKNKTNDDDEEEVRTQKKIQFLFKQNKQFFVLFSISFCHFFTLSILYYYYYYFIINKIKIRIKYILIKFIDLGIVYKKKKKNIK